MVGKGSFVGRGRVSGRGWKEGVVVVVVIVF